MRLRSHTTAIHSHEKATGAVDISLGPASKRILRYSPQTPVNMSSNVLSPKDVNTPVAQQDAAANTKSDVKSMEYHREVFQKKMAAGK